MGKDCTIILYTIFRFLFQNTTRSENIQLRKREYMGCYRETTRLVPILDDDCELKKQKESGLIYLIEFKAY